MALKFSDLEMNMQIPLRQIALNAAIQAQKSGNSAEVLAEAETFLNFLLNGGGELELKYIKFPAPSPVEPANSDVGPGIITV